MSTSWVILLPLIALVVVAGAAATVVTHRAAPRRLEVIRDGGTRRRKKVVVIESQSQHELIITPQPRKGQLLALVPLDIPEAIQYEGGAHNYRLLYSLSYSLRTLSSSSSMPYIVNTSDPLTDQTDGEADRFFQNRTLATVLEKDAAATADPFILEECLKLLKADPALTEALQQHALAASPEVYRVSDLADFCAAVPLDAVTALTPPAVLYPLWLCLHRGFSVTTNRRPYLGLRLDSGLGNQLFRMAALHHLGRKLDRPVAFTGFNIKSPHSGQAYDELFAYWKYCPRNLLTTTAEPWSEPRLSYCGAEIQAYVEQRYVHTHVELKGYFQDYRYVEPGFLPHLQLPPPPLDRYPDVERAVFLHVRGGDYVRSALHAVPLERYYERAIALFPKGTSFYLFTNDRKYAHSLPWLARLPNVTWIDEPELISLVLMGCCGGGAICANSSFSWWGARMNPNRRICMPDRWYTDPTFVTEGYYFPGVTQVATA